MSTALSGFLVMQQHEWAGRRFYTAQDRRTGQVVHMMEDPTGTPAGLYNGTGLPSMDLMHQEDSVRWLVGPMPEGESLEDLRQRGALSEQAIQTAMLSVLEALSVLVRTTPPLVPAYLDPACIRRDRLGTWVLDYPALAHAPEVRMTPSLPLGVYPFGVLLFWMVTGQLARRTRVQVARMQHGVPPTLQFIVIKCLGRSYPSLAELRADLQRAGSEREFRSVVGLIANQREQGAVTAVPPMRIRVSTVLAATPHEEDPLPPPELLQTEQNTLPELSLEAQGPDESPPPASSLLTDQSVTPVGGPTKARPWALPPRPSGGFRQAVLPNQRAKIVAFIGRWGKAGLVSAIAFAAAVVIMLKLGGQPIGESGTTPTPNESGTVKTGREQTGHEPGRRPAAPPTRSTTPSAPAESPSGSAPAPGVQPKPAEQPAPAPAANPVPASVTSPPSSPAPAKPPETSTGPALPPKPEPGSVAHQDAAAGGTPYRILLDGRQLGYAYLFPHPNGPLISLGAINGLFGRSLYWAPSDVGRIRVYTGDRNFVTTDYHLQDGRLWLRMTPSVLQGLGMELQKEAPPELHFRTR